ncbi:MAG TPA: hypothetical protein VNL71_00600 [Chloroflexota bacterium]|nr:hypothetical protein [Chloroflexota bacterium]
MATVDRPPYEQILDQAGRLDPEEQLRLLEDLAALVRRGLTPPIRHVITELRGLGKAVWQDVDAQDYVNQERASWDG